MSVVTTTAWMEQTPALSIHEIADRLWAAGEHAAYRALKAYIKERDNMLRELHQRNTNAPP